MSSQRYLNRKKYGHVFTLIEVLVVLAIIGILSTTLFSVLNMAKEQMNSQECVENERYIYSSIIEYSNGNQGKVVPCSKLRFDDDDDKDPTGTDWYETLEGYGLEPVQQPDDNDDGKLYNTSLYCPISGKTGQEGLDDYYTDYGLNWYLAPNGENPGGENPEFERPLRFASIESLSEKVLLADTSSDGTILRGDYRLRPSLININQVVGTNGSYGRFAFRHPTPMGDDQDQSDGECNMVFADGRVEAVHFSDDRVSSQANLDKMLKPKDD